ncbi:MAG: peptidase S10 [Cyanobacteriota bacterium]|nr:peptidase S10 [Cyanobacteriota bacterium]
MSDTLFAKTSRTEHRLILPQQEIAYTAIAGWQPLYESEKPIAQMFHVAYLTQPQASQGSSERPITFVFNGGPGAAAAYLHMGSLGPKRVAFGQNGSLPKPPTRVVDNPESWLSFTDLVFIDPIGTGFSRYSPEKKESKPTPEGTPSDKSSPDSAEPEPAKVFWEVERDIKSLGEFIQRFLSRHQRWLSPVFIAGESYGGFRVAKLARHLQQGYGVGLSGAILISPAIEFSLLYGNDYNLTAWASLIPSFAATARHHGRAHPDLSAQPLADFLGAAEQFAQKILIPFLALGGRVEDGERQVVFQQLSRWIGLPPSVIERHDGRITIEVFARELLRDQRRIVGLYDGSMTAIDPFPDRLTYGGADPTLDGIDRLFTAAINSHLRQTLQVETDLTYHLLNEEVFKAWKFNSEGELKQGYLGSLDDLRIGMSLNPYMQVVVSHGIYDLVTAYFGSNYLATLMKLAPELRPNLTLKHYLGGHMFYSWDDSRQAWFSDMRELYQRVLCEQI